MINFPHIDPVAFSVGVFKVHWYGLMYLFGFAVGWFLARRRALNLKEWSASLVDDFVTWIMLGVIIGARLGYIIFYDLAEYVRNPAEIFMVWNGGMSFHGGLLGVLFAIWLFARRNRMDFLSVIDFTAPLVPPGLFLGRLGNFINAELWGAPTDLPWGIIFPGAGQIPRHPSQLYEALLEGLLLFVILWIYSAKKRPPGRVSGLFAIIYSLCRFGVEFVREPDAHIGYIAFGWLTMGQVLCLPLLFVGLWLILRDPYGTNS